MSTSNGGGTPPLDGYVCPSLLSCDLSNTASEAKEMLEMDADWLHMDVMDGHFVPNISFGPPVIASLHKANPSAFLDCHLMVSEPAKWVTPMAKAGASQFTFHLEATMPDGGPRALIAAIRRAGMKVGIAVKPKTPALDVVPYADLVDLLLVMTVEPGFSGQSFMADMMPKVEELRRRFPQHNIQVDGGLGPKTIEQATTAGANVIVSASAIFGSDDKRGVIGTLRDSLTQHQFRKPGAK